MTARRCTHRDIAWSFPCILQAADYESPSEQIIHSRSLNISTRAFPQFHHSKPVKQTIFYSPTKDQRITPQNNLKLCLTIQTTTMPSRLSSLFQKSSKSSSSDTASITSSSTTATSSPLLKDQTSTKKQEQTEEEKKAIKSTSTMSTADWTWAPLM